MTRRVYTACVTPFQQDTTIDFESLKSLVLRQDRAGHGMVLLGSTGESMALSLQERQDIVQWALQQPLQNPVIVGVPGYGYDDALAWVAWCRDQGVQGFLMTSPIYAKPGIAGQVHWFRALMDAAQRPCMLYHIPGRAGSGLHPETVAALRNHPAFWAIKDSGGCWDTTVTYRQAAPHVDLYCGDDDRIASVALLGVRGLVSVASNAWPVAAGRYVDSVLGAVGVEGKSGVHVPDHGDWWRACQSLFCTSNPVPIKALLAQKGWITCNHVRLPLSQDDCTQDMCTTLAESDRTLAACDPDIIARDDADADTVSCAFLGDSPR